MKSLLRIVLQNTIMLILPIVSACSGQNETLINNYQINHTTINPNLHINVVDQLPASEDKIQHQFGYLSNSKQITNWLRTNMTLLNNTGCRLRQPIALTVSISKLYSNIDSDNIVGTLVIKGQYYIHGKRVLTKSYRAESLASILAWDEKQSQQSSMNIALQQIIAQLRYDICGL